MDEQASGLQLAIQKNTKLLIRFLDPNTTNSEGVELFEQMQAVYHSAYPHADLDPRWLTVLSSLRDLGARQGLPAMVDAMLEMWQRYFSTREKP